MSRSISKLFDNIIISIGILSASFLMLYFSFGFILFKMKEKGITDWSFFGISGDFVGGILGTVIAAITLLYVIKTYKQQSIYIQKQNFESTFFKMLDTIYTIGKDFKIHDSHKNFFVSFIHNIKPFYDACTQTKSLNQNEFFFTHQTFNKVILQLANDKDTPFYIEPVSDISIYHHMREKEGKGEYKKFILDWVISDLKNEEKFIGYLFREMFWSSDSELGHFFRYIHNTLDFAIQERKKFGDESKYINLIQAQLSNAQLIVLLYNCISPLSLNSDGEKEFHRNLDKYQVFKNIQPNLLLNTKHCKFFPNTQFKFLLEHEK